MASTHAESSKRDASNTTQTVLEARSEVPTHQFEGAQKRKHEDLIFSHKVMKNICSSSQSFQTENSKRPYFQRKQYEPNGKTESGTRYHGIFIT